MWGILLKIGLWAVEQFILRQGGKSKSQKQFYELVKALEEDSLISAGLRASYDEQYKDLQGKE